MDAATVIILLLLWQAVTCTLLLGRTRRVWAFLALQSDTTLHRVGVVFLAAAVLIAACTVS